MGRGVDVGPGPSVIKRALSFFCFFLVLNLFYSSPMVYFIETISFQGSRGGKFFQGVGVQLVFKEGVLFPIETYITCDFPVESAHVLPLLLPLLYYYCYNYHYYYHYSIIIVITTIITTITTRVGSGWVGLGLSV